MGPDDDDDLDDDDDDLDDNDDDLDDDDDDLDDDVICRYLYAVRYNNRQQVA